MLDPHAAYVIKVIDVKAAGKRAALFALLGRFDILVRCKVVHDQRNPALVEDLVESGALKGVDGDGSGDVVGKNHVEIRADQLAGNDGVEACVCRQDFLCHCETHCSSSLS